MTSYDHEARPQATAVNTQSVDSVMELLQTLPGTPIEKLSALAVATHCFMQQEEINSFESIHHNGSGIRITCTSSQRVKPTLH